MIVLIILVVLSFVLFYLQSYFKLPKETNIIQTPLETFHPDLLLEKQPIYLYENIYNPADVIGSIFKYQYIQKVLSLSNKSYTKKNLSKYLLIYNDREDVVNIHLTNPTNKKNVQYYNGFFVNKFYKVSKNNVDIDMIKVILKPHNMIIIPMGWIYHSSVDNILEIHLFDSISRVYSFLA